METEVRKIKLSEITAVKKGFLDPYSGEIYAIPEKGLHETLAREVCGINDIKWKYSAEDSLIKEGWIKISRYGGSFYRYVTVESTKLKEKVIYDWVIYLSSYT